MKLFLTILLLGVLVQFALAKKEPQVDTEKELTTKDDGPVSPACG
ncbi:unnamed protein product, partial [Schistocephalus solidus]|uniref:Secreted protein n=1 Tax=Schistocephalus solidus TaxID=70667 RepID=A0A183SC80_SCHSO